jgi:hypothetical protein
MREIPEIYENIGHQKFMKIEDTGNFKLLEALSIIFQYDIEMREIPEIYEN